MTYSPGDIFLSHSTTFLGQVIRFGERLRVPKRDAFWNHAGIIIDSSGNTLEAVAKGISQRNLDDHPIRVTIDSGMTLDQRASVLAFAHSCIGDPYSFLDDVFIGVRLLTGLHLAFHGSRSMICSQFAAKSWEHGGKIWPKLDMACVMPADIAEWALPPAVTKDAKNMAAMREAIKAEPGRFVFNRHIERGES